MHRYQSTRGQRLFILFIIFILPIFLFREYKLLSEKKSGAIITEDTYYEHNPKIELHHHFSIIVPVEERDISLMRNAQSILKQSYTGYSVDYILVNPTQRMQDEIDSTLGASQNSRFVSIHSVASKEALFQKYIDVIASQDNETVVVHLSGEDWFANDDALSFLDGIYQNQDVWLTYSKYMNFPDLRKKQPKTYSHGRYFGKRVHRAPWVTAPCKTFYARLFKEAFGTSKDVFAYNVSQRKVKELLTPVADIGRMHVRFIPEVLYVHADVHAMKRRVMSLGSFGERCAEAILQQKKSIVSVSETPVHAFVFSSDSPDRLAAFLKDAQEKVHGLGVCCVFFRESEPGIYHDVKKAYPNYVFYNVTQFEGDEIRHMLLDTVHSLSANEPYLLLTRDQATFEREIDLSKDKEKLYSSRASAMYYHLSSKESGENAFHSSLEYAATRFCGEGYYTWNIKRGKNAFQHPDTFLCTLYANGFLERFLRDLSITSFDELFEIGHTPAHGVGMFHVASSAHFSE